MREMNDRKREACQVSLLNNAHAFPAGGFMGSQALQELMHGVRASHSFTSRESTNKTCVNWYEFALAFTLAAQTKAPY